MEELYLHDIEVKDVSSSEDSDFPDTTEVWIYAADKKGEPVFVNVKKFKPWFFCDDSFTKTKFEEIINNSKGGWLKKKMSFEMVKRKKLVGFTDSQEFNFAKLSFTNNIPMNYVKKILRKDYPNIKLYEDRVETVLKFFHSTKIHPSSYFQIKNFKLVSGVDKGISYCEKEYSVDINSIFPIVEERPPPPMVICSYDIEASGLDHNIDAIFQVSMCFSKLGDNLNGPEFDNKHATDACDDGFVICVGDTESLDNTPLICVDTEQDLLLEFKNQLIKKKVMFLTGYNTYQYDSQFLYNRATKIYHQDSFLNSGFIRNEKIKLETKVLESSALGRTELSRMIIPGRVEVDALMVLRRTAKLPSYKLNSVCDHYFGGEKDDVTYSDILEAYRTKDRSKLGVIAKYCYQDSFLVLRLVDKLKEIYNCVQMSDLCTVPLTYILSRGQQIKCYSLILNTIYGEFICNHISKEKKEGEEDGFQGATVIDAKTGFYPNDPIVCLDFASLYPSIMRWKQLCYSTFINDEKYRNIDGVHYEDYEVSPGRVVTFAHRIGNKSVLCKIEDSLIDERKKTKKQMKGETDPFKYSLLDSKQLAQKVTCNSLYGYCGASNGSLPLKEIAAAVTYTGRKMIETTSRFVEKRYGCNVIYGDTDSVMVTFPLPNEIKNAPEGKIMKYLFKIGEEAGIECTKLFGHPVLLEFENVYTRYLLVSKKRYAALSWLSPEGPPKLCTKGLVTVRRDCSPIVSKTATNILNLLMHEKKENIEIERYVKNILLDLENGNIPLGDLTIRKELKKWEYKNPVPHSILAHRIIKRSKNQRFFREFLKDFRSKDFDDNNLKILNKEVLEIKDLVKDLDMDDFLSKLKSKELSKWAFSRDDVARINNCHSMIVNNKIEYSLIEHGIGNKRAIETFCKECEKYDLLEWDSPRLGDRIPYVVIKGKGDINTRAELPDYVEKANISTDSAYYITRQLKNPLCGLMDLFMDKDSSEIFKPFERRANNSNKGMVEITSFFKRSNDNVSNVDNKKARR